MFIPNLHFIINPYFTPTLARISNDSLSLKHVGSNVDTKYPPEPNSVALKMETARPFEMLEITSILHDVITQKTIIWTTTAVKA
jgi:hypothetical protein